MAELGTINGVTPVFSNPETTINAKDFIDGQVINGADVVEPVTGTLVLISIGSASTTTACGQTANVTKYASSAQIPLGVGDIVYNEIGLTTVYNGKGFWYKYGIGRIQIGADGIIDAVGIC